MRNETYEPQPQQARCHALCRRKKFGLLLGGVGAGKTIVGCHEILYSAHENPDCDGLIGAPTYPMIRDVILPTWERWIDREIWTWRKADQLIELWTGQNIFFRSATEPERIRGLNIGYGWIDEIAMIRSRKFWDLAKARLRDPRAKKPRLLATTTPAGKTYLIDEFSKGEPDHFVIRARTRDNAHLPPDYETGLRAAYGAEFAAQELDAEIVALQGLAWPIFPLIHILPPDAIMAIRGRAKSYFGGIDWGFTNAAAIVIGAWDGESWTLVDAWKRPAQNRDAIAAQANAMGRKYGVRAWYADHDPEGVGHCRKLGMNVQLAEKDVVAGVQHVRSLLAVRTNGQPRFFLPASMKEWIAEAEAYAFAEGDETPTGANGDHLLDATRYMIYSHAMKHSPFDFKTGGGKSRYSEMRR